MKERYLNERTFALFLPIALAILLCAGPAAAPWLAVSLSVCAWGLKGKVGKPDGILWTGLALLSCLSVLFGGDYTLASCLILAASGVMLWQELGAEGRRAAKLWCFRIAAVLAIYVIAGTYSLKAGKLEVIDAPIPMEAMSVLFALSALSDISSRRRFLLCVALGASGHPLGLICLGAGLLMKKHGWQQDLFWTLLGVFWLVCPWPIFSFLITAFLYWCVPETVAFLGHGTKWHFLPFLLAALNPWSLLMLGDWGLRMAGIVQRLGPAGMGLTDVGSGLGILCALALAACAMLLCRMPAGYGWMICLVFGTYSVLPGLLLCGIGTGMADAPEEGRVDGKPFCLTLMVLSLFLVLQSGL